MSKTLIWQVMLDWKLTTKVGIETLIRNFQSIGIKFIDYGTWYGVDENGIKCTDDMVYVRFQSTEELFEMCKQANNAIEKTFDGYRTIIGK